MRSVAGRVALICACLAAGGTGLFAQLPPEASAPGRGRPALPPRAGIPPPGAGAVSNEEVYQLLDTFVLGRAQGALMLNDSQYFAFFQRMQRLQRLQRQHRVQRQRLLNELRLLVGPRAPQATDDAAIAAKTKELDDAEAQMAQDEHKALADIDEVLQIRQRAHFRVFLENTERQKLELLIKARQGAPPVSPPSAASPTGRSGR